jgi:predicted Zn-dependent protease
MLRWREGPADRSLAPRLSALAREVDDDQWRNDIRDALERPAVGARCAALLALASRADTATLPAPTLALLAAALLKTGEARAAGDLLETAQFSHRNDPWIYQELGTALLEVRPSRPEDALRAFTAAYALLSVCSRKAKHGGDAERRHGALEDQIARLRAEVRQLHREP